MKFSGEMRPAAILLTLLLAACGGGGDVEARTEAENAAETERVAANGGDAEPYWQVGGDPTAEEIERGRMDAGWRRVVEIDTTAADSGATSGGVETWEQIDARRVNAWPMRLPLSGDVEGPSVMRLQVLLDRARFSPGIIDGRWGKNTAKALYWMQRREGLPATGRLDERSFQRLVRLAGEPAEIVTRHTLTAEEVEGPFVEIPEDIYEKAELECMCYESLTEKLAETFHVSPELLGRLNPGVELDSLSAGDAIHVPAVRGGARGATGQVARLVVSDRGHYVHALDGSGRILFHFPSTLGSSYDPSPSGDFQVNSVTLDPWWHYQPDLLEHVDDSEEDARIPPGPNNAVGLVWMDLSKPHFGIHGTSAPATIGYTTSAGCVRLTNWDALFLADHVRPGTPVEFRDT